MNREEIHTRSMDLVNRFNKMANHEETGVVMNAIFTLTTYVLHSSELRVRLAFVEALLEVNRAISEEPNEAGDKVH